MFHRKGFSTCLCNSLLHQRCEFSIKLSQDPTGTCWTVTWEQACWMDHAAFLHLKSKEAGKELQESYHNWELSAVRLHLFCTSKRTLSSLITLNTYTGKFLILANKEQKLLSKKIEHHIKAMSCFSNPPWGTAFSITLFYFSWQILPTNTPLPI